jgi:hypothetical protein
MIIRASEPPMKERRFLAMQAFAGFIDIEFSVLRVYEQIGARFAAASINGTFEGCGYDKAASKCWFTTMR